MTIFNLLRSAPLAAALALLPLSGALAHDHVLIRDATVRSVPPTAPTAAGYLVIENHRAVPVHVTGVSSDVAAQVAMHTVRRSADGMMVMEPLADGIVLPAGGSHSFAPGGDHVMFMGLKAPLEQGAKVPVTFHFEGLSDVTVEMTVDHARMREGMGAGHGTHGGMPMGAGK